MKLSAHIDAVLSVLKHAVFVDIPCLQRVSPRRAGIKQLGDLLRAPRPKALRCDICGNGQVDLHLIIPAGEFHRLAVLPCFGVFPDGIIQGIEHPARFVEIALEQVVLSAAGKVARFCLRHFRLGQLAPVTGGGRQFSQRCAGKSVFIPAGYIFNSVVRPVVAADHITHHGNIPGTVCGCCGSLLGCGSGIGFAAFHLHTTVGTV